MNNKKSGTNFEKMLCEKIAEQKIWARLEYPAEDGSQPFDVKAIYRDNIFIFECKDCKNGYFDLNRIEENQKIALKILQENVIDNKIMFALNFDGDWQFIEANDIFYELEWGEKKKLKKEYLYKYSMNFSELINWMKRIGNW